MWEGRRCHAFPGGRGHWACGGGGPGDVPVRDYGAHLSQVLERVLRPRPAAWQVLEAGIIPSPKNPAPKRWRDEV